MIGGLRRVLDPLQQFAVVPQGRAGGDFKPAHGGHGGGFHDLADDAHAGQGHLAVVLGGEEIKADFRRRLAVRLADMDGARGFRTQGMGNHRDAGLFVQLETFRHQKRHEADTDIGRGKTFAAADIGPQGRGRQAQQAGPRDRVAQGLKDRADAPHFVVVGMARRLDFPLHAGGKMVAQVFAHAGQGVAHFYSMLFQQFRLANSGQLQQLRRIDGAGADHHLAPGQRGALAAVHRVTDAGAAGALERQTVRMGAGDNGQIASPHGRVQIAARRGHATALADGRLCHGDAFLHGAVVIGVVGNTHLSRGGHDRIVEGTALVQIGDLQGAVAAAEFIVAARISFHFAEVRQDVTIAPAAIAQLRPGIIILGLAAHENHAVDGRRAAQQLAPRHIYGAVCAAFLWLRFIQPVGLGIINQTGKSNRHPGPGMVGAPGLQQQNGKLAAGAQPVGQHRPRRPRTHNDEIVFAVAHVSLPMHLPGR